MGAMFVWVDIFGAFDAFLALFTAAIQWEERLFSSPVGFLPRLANSKHQFNALATNVEVEPLSQFEDGSLFCDIVTCVMPKIDKEGSVQENEIEQKYEIIIDTFFRIQTTTLVTPVQKTPAKHGERVSTMIYEDMLDSSLKGLLQSPNPQRKFFQC
ncbi:hypothetical protein JTE90_021731 [Oedothorax gibbosus]|uniref:Uncharacterized protein n=1 Tax=Oedothorax gibbosus TaxID=931172 RepID=A0AAV6UFX9_9ARAC|nr:hypothetical protein JTE90_021731 [Oedothorax gibbosus]